MAETLNSSETAMAASTAAAALNEVHPAIRRLMSVDPRRAQEIAAAVMSAIEDSNTAIEALADPAGDTAASVWSALAVKLTGLREAADQAADAAAANACSG